MKDLAPQAADCCGSGDLPDVTAALHRIATEVTPCVGSESLPLVQAMGRILTAPVHAGSDSPPFDAAAMDGYALSTEGLAGPSPWRIPVVGRAIAGSPPQPLRPGTAMRIFTGAAVPSGADTVVPQEAVARAGDTLELRGPLRAGQHIRHRASDLAQGQEVLASGRRVGAAEIAAAAACGARQMQVCRPVRAALLVTGPEARPAGGPRAAGQIWDVNTPMLLGLLAGAEVHVEQTRRLTDDAATLARTIAELSTTSDLIVTTGGASVGETDALALALEQAGARVWLRGVAMKPGKPVTMASLGNATILGLPGNPVAAFIAWQVLGEAALRRMTGATGSRPPCRVRLASGFDRRPGRTEFRPASIMDRGATGSIWVHAGPSDFSAGTGILSRCDGFIVIPPDCTMCREGDSFDFLAKPWSLPRTPH